MTARTKLMRLLLACAAAGALLAGCAAQRIKSDAEDLMRAGSYEQALARYDEGQKRYPDDVPLRASATRARSEIVARLIGNAATLRALQRYDDAMVMVDRAIKIDPASERARAMKLEVERDRRTAAAIAAANEQIGKEKFDRAREIIETALRDSPRNPDLVGLQRRVEGEMRKLAEQKSLRLAESRPVSLQFRDANLKMVLEAFSRSTGVNFVLDRDIRPDQRVTVFLRNATVEDALDLLTSTNQLGKKVLDPNTVLVYPNNPEKQKEYQDLVIRAFYLASADAKQTAALLRSMLKLREVFIDEKLNLIVIREPLETIRLAERLVALHDLSDSEVLLEVEVLEVKRTRLLELGISFPDGLTLTPLSAAGGTGLTLNDLLNLNRNRIGAGIGPLNINARREVSDVNLLANPRIRAKNREKARILIGDRVPQITTSSTAIAQTESIQYVEVGLKLEVEPQVQADDDILIKVALEVSALVREITTKSGALAYQIGTRNANTTLRLRDGETQMLAGLINAEERSSSNRVPGLGDLPVLGRLFSSQLDNNERTEIVLSITPRLVRAPIRPDSTQTEFWSGTETAMRLRPGALASVERDADKSAGDKKAVAADTRSASASAVPAATASAPVPVTSDALRISLSGPNTVRAGETFAVQVGVTSQHNLRGLPTQLSFDAARLKVEAVEEGPFFKQGGGEVSISHQVAASEGRLLVALTRGGATGVKGSDAVFRVTLRALGWGDATIAVTGATPIAAGEALPPLELPPPLQVQIK